VSFYSPVHLFVDTVWITWEPTLVEPFTNAPLVEQPHYFVQENFETNGERLDKFCERLENDRDRFGCELVQALLGGVSDRKVGLYSKFHDFACWKLGYDHPDVVRLATMFTTCLDANKTGLRVNTSVFTRDSRSWDIANLPSCLTPVAKRQYTASPGPYPRREVQSPFVLESIRAAGLMLRDELLCEYDRVGLNRPLDPDLLAPIQDAQAFATKMRRDHSLANWDSELLALRVFVQKCRDGWFGAASPRKGQPANERETSIKSLAVRFERDAPIMPHFALVDVDALRAAAAYKTCFADNEKFAFAMAFRDLCDIKAKKRGDAGPMVKEIREVLTMARSTRVALDGK
jgi:RNA-dependent RNA polymerase